MSIKPFTKLSILLLITGAALGLFLTAQWRAKPSRVTSPVLPYTSLKGARDILQEENENLKKQISDLQSEINQSQVLLQKSRIISSTSLEDLEKLKKQIALVPLSGEGVTIVLADATVSPATSDTIVHAADLRDLINLLWAAGATGLSINNQRVSAFTSIDCIVNTILINNARLTSPFEINAVGNQKQLLKVLEDPTNLPDIYRRRQLGLKFEIKREQNITIPAFDGSYAIQFAKIKE